MSSRDEQRQRGRRGRGRHSNDTQHSHDDVEEEHPYDSLVRVPLQQENTMPFVPNLQYDPRFNFSFFDHTQMQAQNPIMSIPEVSHVGDTSGMGNMSDLISPDNIKLVKERWESPEFSKLTTQNKKHSNNNVDGVGLPLNTCGAIPMIEWHGRMVRISFFMEHYL